MYTTRAMTGLLLGSILGIICWICIFATLYLIFDVVTYDRPQFDPEPASNVTILDTDPKTVF